MSQYIDSLVGSVSGKFPPVVYACDFSFWKKPIVRLFFGASTVVFVRSASQVPANGTLAVWGRKPIPGKLSEGVKLVHLEDGFLRSVGLGADLICPLSWVMDGRGIYYDATQPSDLEHLLQTTDFHAALLERASRLRDRIVAEGLTKYNVGVDTWQRPAKAKRVLLVPGQVENDASIRFGTCDIRTNMGLLRTVREANEDAWIVYKQHPDVQTRLRIAGEGEDGARYLCDEVVLDVPMHVLLEHVDEVHTLTSLTGFEALLRGKPVTTYGQPFFAGWGLTRDVGLLPEVSQRRSRRLSLDELVAGVLILYPTYMSRTTGRFTTPEQALEELLTWRRESAGSLTLLQRVWRRVFRELLRLEGKMRGYK